MKTNHIDKLLLPFGCLLHAMIALMPPITTSSFELFTNNKFKQPIAHESTRQQLNIEIKVKYLMRFARAKRHGYIWPLASQRAKG
jgi:hypothetical protein